MGICYDCKHWRMLERSAVSVSVTGARLGQCMEIQDNWSDKAYVVMSNDVPDTAAAALVTTEYFGCVLFEGK